LASACLVLSGPVTTASFSVTLKPWSSRETRAEQFQEIKQRLNQQLSKLPQGTAFSFSPPAILESALPADFNSCSKNRAGRDVQFLAGNLDKFLAAARKRPEIGSVSTSFMPSVPQKFLDVNQEKVLKQGVAISDVYQTISGVHGRTVHQLLQRFRPHLASNVEAEAPYRSNMENLGQFYVRNSAGQRVPLSALTNFEPRSGPEFTMRYNEYRSAQIQRQRRTGL